jgi:pectin methylesterase-like acyl-CoA thioesterase
MTISINGQGDFATIQAAIDAAGNGDTIEIGAGAYREQLTIVGKNVTIQGAGAGQTIIESPDAAALVANAIDTNSSRTNNPLPAGERERTEILARSRISPRVAVPVSTTCDSGY